MRRLQQAMGIRVRLWLAAALPAVLVTLSLLWVFMDRQERDLTAALADRVRATALQVAGAAEFGLFAGDRQGLQRQVDGLMASDPELLGVAVIPADGRYQIVAGELPALLPPLSPEVSVLFGKVLVVAVPVRYSSIEVDDLFAQTPEFRLDLAPQGLAGQVVVVFDLKKLRAQRRDLLVWAVLVTVVALGLAAVMSTVIASSVTRPMAGVSKVVEQIGLGQLHARADVLTSGPLDGLARGINAMASRIAMTQDDLRQQVAAATRELRLQKEAAEQAARIDTLTGVASRRAFTERAELEIQRALRYRQPLSVVMVDLDRFKRINDTYGHAVGDAVLVSFAQVLLSDVREVDMVGRLGGEEFAVLLPGIEGEEAMRVAERMRVAVEAIELKVGGQRLRFTASFGVANFDGMEVNLPGLLARADAALYQAKHTGRNRVVYADQSVPSFEDTRPAG
ncbi:GGDEF domain-containing protein [Tepidicella baoligensis]|uniref:GGDEF domain-containing protein n=1 Tax=Tepidicella baoligensis TaxID=2707016 RepID=UPI0015D9E21F|nr:GGDEF domain-containing protein [Tepidicella baoligensis]